LTERLYQRVNRLPDAVGPMHQVADRAGATPPSAPARPAQIVELLPRLPRRQEPEVLPEGGSTSLAGAARRAPAEPPGRVGLAAKRFVDLLGAFAGLMVVGPLLLATAATIALVDGRPVLFRQPRAGRNARPFRIYKFRTMRIGADAERAVLRARNEVAGGASFKMTDDPRVTRLGRFLRRTSLDEFPQLLNVIRGEMSLVGPRPHPFDDLAGYQPWHHGRFAMKPGITGLWQVSSRRDPNFDRWVELDLEYIRTWSPLLDLKIMARTIPAMVRGEGR
jgi:lipopolysaccharide/colanic/teichoic acid biosynthesis glycosyltransferase